MKHARAEHVWIRLRSGSKELEVRVEDDGVGIAGDSTSIGGLGLKIMEFRARMIDGRFLVRPRSQGGTSVICDMVSSD
jgi:signal transduction histidine kinase